MRSRPLVVLEALERLAWQVVVAPVARMELAEQVGLCTTVVVVDGEVKAATVRHLAAEAAAGFAMAATVRHLAAEAAAAAHPAQGQCLYLGKADQAVARSVE